MEKISPLIKRSFSEIRRVTKHYGILGKNSSVVVAVSGGVDSYVLLYLLSQYNIRYSQKWDIYACHVDPGFTGWDSQNIAKFCRDINVECQIIKTNIDTRIKVLKKKCFFCARERRRKLLEYAESVNTFQIALGHHMEDVVETFLLNIIYNGEISTFVPVQSVIHGRFYFIRPLYYLNRKTIQKIGRTIGIPENTNLCPYYHLSKRQRIRDFLSEISNEYPEVYQSIFNGIRNIKRTYLPLH